MLKLCPTLLEPVRAAPGRAELGMVWDALHQEGRRLLLAQARAVLATAQLGVDSRSAGPEGQGYGGGEPAMIKPLQDAMA